MEPTPIGVVVYYCRNLRLFENGQQKVFARSRPGLKLVAIPCSGKMEAHHILKTLAGGAAGVLILACEEKACQYLEGSMRSRKRFEYARTWLAELGIDTGRIEFVHISPMDVESLDQTLTEFTANLRRLGNIEAVSTL